MGRLWVTTARVESGDTALLGQGEERLGREGMEKTGIGQSLEFSVRGVEKWGGGRRTFRSKGEFPLPLFLKC